MGVTKEGRRHTRRLGCCPMALVALAVEEVESDLPVRNSLPEGMLSAMMKVVFDGGAAVLDGYDGFLRVVVAVSVPGVGRV
jgi:hypothetical protein